MPENCDAACVKNIINTRLVAYIARLLAEAAGEGHPLYRPALKLAAAARAACEAYAVATEEGTLVRTDKRSGWNGCDDAAFLVDLADKISNNGAFDARSARIRIDAMTAKANSVTARLVRVQEG